MTDDGRPGRGAGRAEARRDVSGHRRARRRPDRLRGLRHGATDRRCCCRPGRIVHVAVLEGAGRRYLARHHRVVTFDGRGNGRSDRPAGAAAYADARVRRRHGRGDGRHRDGPGGPRRRSRAAPPGRCTSPPSTPSGSWGIFAIAPACGFAGPTRASAVRAVGRALPDDTDGLGEVQQALLARGRLRRLPRVLLRADVPRAALDQADRGLRRLGPRDRPAARSSTPPPASSGSTARVDDRLEPLCARVRCPVLVRPRHATTGCAPPARTASGSPSSPAGSLVLLEGAGHGPMSRHPVLVNLMIRDVRRTGSGRPASGARRAWTRGRGAGRAGAVPLLADRARPRPARPGHRRRAARSCTRTSRSTGSPSTRSPRCSRRAGERVHPASRWLANESAHIEHEAGEHDLHAFQAIRADGRDPGQQLHGVRRGRRAASTTTSSSATRPGTSTTSCTRTPSSSAFAFAWMTDFVGWLPMPDGGERGGGAHRRLQRRDDRAAGALPRACATARSSSATPTTSCRDRFGPGLPTIRDWTARRTSTSPATSPASTPPTVADRAALRRELGYRPDERRLRGHRRRLRRRRRAAAPGPGRRARWRAAAARTCGSWSSPGRGSTRRRCPRRRASTVRGYVPRPLPAPGRLRPRRRAGRAHHDAWSSTASRRPFVYVPLQHHFEQNFHVRHRLDRYGAGPLPGLRRGRRSRRPRRGHRRRARPDGVLPAGGDRRGGRWPRALLADLL